MSEAPRRIVTGHAPDGRSVIARDERLAPIVNPTVGVSFFEVWNTQATPVPVDNAAGPPERLLQIAPNPNGSVIRVVEFPPETPESRALSGEAAREAFAQMGNAHDSTWDKSSPHPLMHRTETVDYGIVLEGEIHLVLTDSETRLGPGDIVVQRGTDHAWANRSDKPARMAFILLDGRFASELKSLINPH